MTRDGELLRVGAKGLRSNELRYVVVDLDDADADEALAWLAGEYLRAFGPIRAKDFTWWAGVTAGRAKQALAAHETEELDGGLLIRAEDRKAFEKAKPVKDAVDLLPKWDSYTMGYAPDGRDRFAHPDVVKQCYDFRGDGRPVILVDGQAAGTWEKGEVDLFEKVPAKTRKAIDARLEAVKAFLDS
jgi:Winged helix DNA-binding domain